VDIKIVNAAVDCVNHNSQSYTERFGFPFECRMILELACLTST